MDTSNRNNIINFHSCNADGFAYVRLQSGGKATILEFHVLKLKLNFFQFSTKLNMASVTTGNQIFHSSTHVLPESGIQYIDRVYSKLEKSNLNSTPKYKQLIDEIVEYVLPFWNSKWRGITEMKSIVNKRSLFKEIEESIPSIHHILTMMQQQLERQTHQINVNKNIQNNQNNKNHNNDKDEEEKKQADKWVMGDKKNNVNEKVDDSILTFVDICSGKGILSILIASLIKLVPRSKKKKNSGIDGDGHETKNNNNNNNNDNDGDSNCNYDYSLLSKYIKRMYLIDRKWDMQEYLDEFEKNRIAQRLKNQEKYSHRMQNKWKKEKERDEKQNKKKKNKNKNEKQTNNISNLILNTHLSIISNDLEIELIPLRMNIFDPIMLRFVNSFDNIIVNAIHLCRRLSVRTIELFNKSDNIKSILLAPCCLPPKASRIIRIGPLNHVGNNNIGNIGNSNGTLCICQIKQLILISKNDELSEKNNSKCNCLKAYNLVPISKNSNLNKLNKKIAIKEEYNDKYDGEKCDIFLELLPRDLIQSIDDIDDRYWNWISFLYNGINVSYDNKQIFRIALQGGSHRCDCYIVASK